MNPHLSLMGLSGRAGVLLFSVWCCLQAIPAVAQSASNHPASNHPQEILETPFFRFTLVLPAGTFEIQDKQAGTTWNSHPFVPRFGEASLRVRGQLQRVPLVQPEVRRVPEGLELVFQPLADSPGARLRITIRSLPDQRSLEFGYSADPALEVDSIRLLDHALWISDADAGYVVVPVREGLRVPANTGKAFTHRFDTYAYEGCHMEMLGLVKNGAAALLTWSDPYVAAELESVLTNSIAGANQILSTSLVLRQSAQAFRFQCLGRGDYVSIAGAYREVARRQGWLVTWEDKLAARPRAAEFFGAINFKLWSTLTRQMNDASTQEMSVRVKWTFDEAAQVAEHLKRDLKLDRVLFILGGWIRRGYDNQHPDILPAAPECGGNDGLADCSRRVRQLGYLFCLHDNYQDIYRDSPSWSEEWIMKNRDGSLSQGGKWAGGRAYLTCSPKALELARRPQNLPAVQSLTQADAYFIDTTYAAGLQECFDPQHPLTRADDLKWKQALSDYAREIFGLFGSECGREWALPHSDFFEGLTGVSGHTYHDTNLVHKLSAEVVPLFELVYRDTIAMYGKYGYNSSQAAGYVLQHLAIGRPLHYHNIPSHLYWQRPGRESAAPKPAPGAADPAVFLRADNGWAEGLHAVDRFVKNTYEILSPLNEITSRMRMTQHQFLTADRQVQRSVFGAGPEAVEVVVNSGTADYPYTNQTGATVKLPPFGFLVRSPSFVAFHAYDWNGLVYEAPVLFTLRSLDAQPLDRSRQVRVYHGFGDARIKFGDRIHTVTKEAVLPPRTP